LRRSAITANDNLVKDGFTKAYLSKYSFRKFINYKINDAKRNIVQA